MDFVLTITIPVTGLCLNDYNTCNMDLGSGNSSPWYILIYACGSQTKPLIKHTCNNQLM